MYSTGHLFCHSTPPSGHSAVFTLLTSRSFASGNLQLVTTTSSSPPASRLPAARRRHREKPPDLCLAVRRLEPPCRRFFRAPPETRPHRETQRPALRGQCRAKPPPLCLTRRRPAHPRRPARPLTSPRIRPSPRRRLSEPLPWTGSWRGRPRAPRRAPLL